MIMKYLWSGKHIDTLIKDGQGEGWQHIFYFYLEDKMPIEGGKNDRERVIDGPYVNNLGVVVRF